MPRFYVAQPLAEGLAIDLPPEVAHHLGVLRLAPGDSLTLFNGEGGEYTAQLADVQKKRASVLVQSFQPREAELPFALTLAQGLPEGSKMDWIIEKAVELGAVAVQPLAAQRSVVKLSAERAEKKLEHWRGIAVSAAEQCGRNRLLQVAAPLSFRDWMGQPGGAQRVLLTPRATAPLAAWARAQAPQTLTVMVGPEGGFSEDEEAAALRAGALPLSMGPRVLRTETAGLAALAVLAAVWGGLD